MKQIDICRKNIIIAGVIAYTTASIFFPSLSHASELTPEFFVSAWLVRIWLALVSATAIVVGLLVALDSRIVKSSLEPKRAADGSVVIGKEYKLSYRRLGGGLLCAILGCTFFVTSVFLLPDKRTGNSGINKIITRFSDIQGSSTVKLPGSNHNPPTH